MLNRNAVIAVLTASTFLTSGVVYAANDQTQKTTSLSQPGQQQAEQDFRKLSKDSSQAFMDLRLARLAIFDGQTDQAKQHIDAAEKGFDKAKSDDSVFTAAEDHLRNGMSGQGAQSASAQAGQDKDQTQTNRSSSTAASTGPSNTNSSAANSSGKPVTVASSEPQQWLPVDGEVGLAEDFSATPAKKAALDEANKNLQKGDRQAALDKLKLAQIDVDVAVAVVPVKSTIADVHQAKQMIDAGQYYQASQVLRHAEDGVRFDVAELSGMPKANGPANAGKPDNTSPATTPDANSAKTSGQTGASQGKP